MMTSDKIKDTYYDYFISKYSKYIIKNSILVTAEIKNIINGALNLKAAGCLLRDCWLLITSHLFDENLSKNNILTSNKSLICTWHLNRLCVIIGMKEDSKVNILLRF